MKLFPFFTLLLLSSLAPQFLHAQANDRLATVNITLDGQVEGDDYYLYSNGDGIGGVTLVDDHTSPTGSLIYFSEVVPAKLGQKSYIELAMQDAAPDTADFELQIKAPPGYTVYVDTDLDGIPDTQSNELEGTTTIGTSTPTKFYYQVVENRALGSAMAGQLTRLDVGDLVFELGLGTHNNGKSAGRLQLRHNGIDGAGNGLPAAVFDHASLNFVGPMTSGLEWVAITDGRKLETDQVKVEVVEDTSTKYTVKFYAGNASTGYGSEAYASYTLEEATSGLPSSAPSDMDCLKITEVQGTVSEGTETVVHYLFRSNTASDTWALIQGTSTEERIQEHSSSSSSGVRTETITTKNSTPTTITKNRLTWTTLSGVEFLTKNEVWSNPAGSPDLTTDYEYFAYSSTAGSSRLLKKVTYPNGGTMEYTYYDDSNKLGLIKTLTEKWSDGTTTSDKVTTYDYNGPLGKFQDYLKSQIVTIGGTTVSKTTHLNKFTAGPLTENTDASLPTNQYSRETKSYYGSGGSDSLTATSLAYRKDASYFLSNRPLKIAYPDGRQQSFAYEEGTNGDSKTWIFEGSHTGGTSKTNTTVNSTSVDFESIKLVTDKSTVTEVIRNEDDNVTSEKTFVWTGMAFDTTAITHTTNTWADGVRQTKSTEINGAEQNWTWKGTYLASTKDPAGIEQTYGYDTVGRTETITRTSLSGTDGFQSFNALTTTFGYDAGNRRTSVAESDGTISRTTSYTYDGAGRPTGMTLPDGRIGSTSYSFSGSDLIVSENLPVKSGGTASTRVTQTLIDGKIKQITGTGVVATYHSYSKNGTTGQITTRTDVASGSSSRWQETVTDWLGRTVEESRPGYTGQADIVTTPTYDATTGLVTKITRTGLADEYRSYDDMAQLIQSGVDLGGSGLSTGDSSDRVTDYETIFKKESTDWWVRSTETIYASTSSPTTPLVAGKSWVRLTGFAANTLSDTGQEDSYGNRINTVATLDRTKRRVTTTTTYPKVSTTAIAISNNGYSSKMTGTDGRSVTQTYDGLGRLYQQVDSRNGTTTYDYIINSGNETNQVSTVTAPTGGSSTVVATYTYDKWGRLESAKNGNNDYAYYSYDSAGRQTRQWGGAVTPVENVYTTYGELWKQRTYRSGTWTGSTWPGGTADETVYTYDGPSGLLTQKKHNNDATRVTDFTYNNRGLVATREWSRLNDSSQRVKTTYAYLANSTELTSKTYNDDTPDVSFTYNRIGQMLTAVDVDNGSTTETRTFVYNSKQQLETEKLPAYLGSRWISYTYEDGTSGTLNGRASGYTIGVSGTLAQDMTSLLGYSASTGNITSLTATHDGVSARAFAYTYASNTSLLTGISQSGINYTQTRAYESDRDLLKEMTTKFSTTTKTRFDYTYNTLSQRISAKQYGQSGSAFADMGGDSFYRYTYNSRGELTLAAGYLGSNIETLTSALPGRYFELGYDQAGNRTSFNATGDVGTKSNYTLNSLNQITGRENHYVPVSGTVDSDAKVIVNGALAGQQGNYWSGEALLSNATDPVYATDISVKSATDSPHEVDILSPQLAAFIASAAEVLRYDLDGNLIEDGRWGYVYDAENRLIMMFTRGAPEDPDKEVSANEAVWDSGVPRRKLIYRYDSLGRRTAKETWTWVSSAWSKTSDVRFVYQGWNLIAELDASGVLQRSHAWGLDIGGTLSGTGGIGALVQSVDHTDSDTSYLPGYDGSGNVTAMMKDDGTIVAAYEYSPFGKLLRKTGDYADDNPFRSATKYTDNETDLVYYGHRYYNPSLGRFINRDPIGEAGGMNLYAFAGNDPANGYDYLGMEGFGAYEWWENSTGSGYRFVESENASDYFTIQGQIDGAIMRGHAVAVTAGYDSKNRKTYYRPDEGPPPSATAIAGAAAAAARGGAGSIKPGTAGGSALAKGNASGGNGASQSNNKWGIPDTLFGGFYQGLFNRDGSFVGDAFYDQDWMMEPFTFSADRWVASAGDEPSRLPELISALATPALDASEKVAVRRVKGGGKPSYRGVNRVNARSMASKISKIGKAGRMLSKGNTLVSSGLAVREVVDGGASNRSVARASVSTFMTGVAIFGGPVGIGASVLYSVGDYFGAFDYWYDKASNQRRF